MVANGGFSFVLCDPKTRQREGGEAKMGKRCFLSLFKESTYRLILPPAAAATATTSLVIL